MTSVGCFFCELYISVKKILFAFPADEERLAGIFQVDGLSFDPFNPEHVYDITFMNLVQEVEALLFKKIFKRAADFLCVSEKHMECERVVVVADIKDIMDRQFYDPVPRFCDPVFFIYEKRGEKLVHGVL